MQKELAYRIVIHRGDKDIFLKEIPKEQRKAFGDWLRTQPLSVLGYIVREESLKVAHRDE